MIAYDPDHGASHEKKKFLDLRGIGPQSVRKEMKRVSIEWSARTGRDIWTVYEKNVYEDVAERLVKTYNATDRLFRYRIQPKGNQ